MYKKDPTSTTPCRRVFDASFHTKDQLSLNDCMLKGPTLTPHILKVLMRLRIKKFLMCADVSKAFLRVLLRYSDRNFTCFFVREVWEDPNSPLAVYRFKVVLFGSTSSPFLLNATILELFEKHGIVDSLIDCYVDNLFFGLNTTDELMNACIKAIAIFDLASLPLREWANNEQQMNAHFVSMGIFTKAIKVLRTLGYDWHFDPDKWTLAQVSFVVDQVTKRSVLSNVCSIYDPLGLINPVIVTAKVFVQSCWDIGIQWDCPLPEDLRTQWIEIVGNLK